jgi:cytochrome c oxidase cbb3-type subunit 3
MTTGWSLFVIVLTLVNILACVWLLRWTMKPKWWLWLFYITVVFGVAYLVLFPGLGTFKGVKGWTQTGQWEQENAAAEARAAEYLAPFASMTVPQLAANAQAMATANNLFQNNCAQCHGADGGGARGFPNLANSDWQWGGDPDTIVQTILNGRVAAMTPWSEVLGAEGVDQVVAYVRQLSGQQHDATLAAAGATHFQTYCMACHGVDGKGMTAVGAPNLTDGIWLYGGDEATLKETVTKGRMGQMPAFQSQLGEQRVRLLAAYVLKLSGGAQ